MTQKYIESDLVMTRTEPNNFTPNGVVCKFGDYIVTDKVLIRPINGIDRFIVEKGQIVPIPLTPEILEKNGWNKRTRTCYDGEHLESFSNPIFPLEHFAIAFTKEGIKATYDCLPVREVKYVSDLQHLLFGLGLNSEMEV